MVKAILELDKMPEGCIDCELRADYQPYAGAWIERWCPICERKDTPKSGRRNDCPLKLVGESEGEE